MQITSKLAAGLFLVVLATAGAPRSYTSERHTSSPAQAHVAAPRQPLTYWSALSTTAIGITGDVELGQHEIVIDDVHRYRIQKVRQLVASEVEAAKDLTGERGLSQWLLYTVHIPASTQLNNGNTMCGDQAATRLVMAYGSSAGAKTLSLIFLSGSKEPFRSGWRETTDSGVCGSFSYIRR